MNESYIFYEVQDLAFFNQVEKHLINCYFHFLLQICFNVLYLPFLVLSLDQVVQFLPLIHLLSNVYLLKGFLQRQVLFPLLKSLNLLLLLFSKLSILIHVPCSSWLNLRVYILSYLQSYCLFILVFKLLNYIINKIFMNCKFIKFSRWQIMHSEYSNYQKDYSDYNEELVVFFRMRWFFVLKLLKLELWLIWIYVLLIQRILENLLLGILLLFLHILVKKSN